MLGGRRAGRPGAALVCLGCSSRPAEAHTCARTLTHARVHTHTDTHRHTHGCTHTYVHTHTRTRTHVFGPAGAAAGRNGRKKRPSSTPALSTVTTENNSPGRDTKVKPKCQPRIVRKLGQVYRSGCRYYRFLFWFQRKVEKSLFHLGRPVKPIK